MSILSHVIGLYTILIGRVRQAKWWFKKLIGASVAKSWPFLLACKEMATRVKKLLIWMVLLHF